MPRSSSREDDSDDRSSSRSPSRSREPPTGSEKRNSDPNLHTVPVCLIVDPKPEKGHRDDEVLTIGPHAPRRVIDVIDLTLDDDDDDSKTVSTSVSSSIITDEDEKRIQNNTIMCCECLEADRRRNYFTPEDLETHVNEEHVEYAPYRCSVCKPSSFWSSEK